MAFREKLDGLPVIGRTLEAYDRYTERNGNFASAAVAFYGFLALFPLIALSAAIVAAALSPGRVRDMQEKISDQIPGIADKVDVNGLVDNAGEVGLVGGLLLLYLGLGWVGALRPAIREMWFGDQPPPDGIEKTLLMKSKDVATLAGLGLAMAVSVGASAFATAVIGHVSKAIGLEDEPVGRILLQVAAFGVAVLAGVVLFLYLLVGMPRLEMPRRTAFRGALIGAVGFEVLKVLVAGYIAQVAGKSMYGVFGVPVALLLWIYFATRLLLFCAAWTATAKHPPDDAGDAGDADGDAEDAGDAEGEEKTGPRSLCGQTEA